MPPFGGQLIHVPLLRLLAEVALLELELHGVDCTWPLHQYSHVADEEEDVCDELLELDAGWQEDSGRVNCGWTVSVLRAIPRLQKYVGPQSPRLTATPGFTNGGVLVSRVMG